MIVVPKGTKSDPKLEARVRALEARVKALNKQCAALRKKARPDRVNAAPGPKAAPSKPQRRNRGPLEGRFVVRDRNGDLQAVPHPKNFSLRVNEIFYANGQIQLTYGGWHPVHLPCTANYRPNPRARAGYYENGKLYTPVNPSLLRYYSRPVMTRYFVACQIVIEGEGPYKMYCNRSSLPWRERHGAPGLSWQAREAMLLRMQAKSESGTNFNAKLT